MSRGDVPTAVSRRRLKFDNWLAPTSGSLENKEKEGKHGQVGRTMGHALLDTWNQGPDKIREDERSKSGHTLRVSSGGSKPPKWQRCISPHL